MFIEQFVVLQVPDNIPLINPAISSFVLLKMESSKRKSENGEDSANKKLKSFQEIKIKNLSSIISG